MGKAELVSSPLGVYFKLCANQSPSSKEEKQEIEKIPYTSTIGSLMYAMVCTRPDIAYTISIVNRLLFNPGMENWAIVK